MNTLFCDYLIKSIFIILNNNILGEEKHAKLPGICCVQEDFLGLIAAGRDEARG